MKKTVYTILIICLLVGLSLIILDNIHKDQFNVPSRFNKLIIDLNEKTRTDELIFESELKVPAVVEFFIQSDAVGEKIVKVVSESKILGLKSHERILRVGQYTGNASTSSTFIMDAGKYSVYLTGDKTDGKIAIGYQETKKDRSEFERLLKIHNGDLNNPPNGYEKIYSVDLTGRISKDETIYTLTIDKTKDIGLSVYISSEKGNVSVDLIGNSSSFIGLVHPTHNRIVDQLQTTLSAGEYRIILTCDSADGQLYIFLKQ